MSKRSRKSDELDAALRAEPDYKELVRLLQRQAPEQKTRTERWLAEQAAQEEGSTVSTDKVDKKVLERIIYFRDKERVPWAKIPAHLEAEGFPAMKEQAARKRYERAGKSPAQRKIAAPQKASLSPSSSLSPKDFAPIPAEWLRPLRSLIHEVLSGMGPKPATLAAIEEFPARPRTARRMLGKKDTLPGLRVDVVLLGLFDQARKQWGLNASETMERLLWLAFNKPKLSYETDAEG